MTRTMVGCASYETSYADTAISSVDNNHRPGKRRRREWASDYEDHTDGSAA